MNRNIKSFILNYRRYIVIVVHLCLMCSAFYLAFLIRFDFFLPTKFSSVFLKTVPLLLVIKLLVFYYFGLFSGLWRYASIGDLWQIIKANIISTAIFIIANVFIYRLHNFPRSIFLGDFIICTLLTGGIRFLTRLTKERYKKFAFPKKQVKVLIVGAGDAGILTLKEYKKNPSMGEVIGFVDDDRDKYNRTIYGVKILGQRRDISAIVEKYNIGEIVLAIPSANGETVRDIISNCRMPGIKLKIIPGLHKILKGEVETKARSVKPEDLLGREVVRIDREEIKSYLYKKRVLITGAAGSIGSTLCSQIVHYEPERIILFDHNENNTYFLEVGLKAKYPHLQLKPIIGDIKDIGLLKFVFSKYQPHVVFHAAAHKHVPLMEDNPAAAVKNNIIGTRNLIYAAEHYKAEKFVLISTDKAVNSTSVMGASKRIAEMILQAKAKNSRTKFMAVRFGNVIGSDGSVIPLFKKQIEEGGPVTVTHPEVKRYFMSATEAAELVLQVGSLGNNGEIYVLDMGEQIKIIELAKSLIILSGLNPEKDIAINFIGLRPGEKLFEEMFLDFEKGKATKHNRIHILQSHDFDRKKLRLEIKKLDRLAVEMKEEEIIKELFSLISTYQ